MEVLCGNLKFSCENSVKSETFFCGFCGSFYFLTEDFPWKFKFSLRKLKFSLGKLKLFLWKSKFSLRNLAFHEKV